MALLDLFQTEIPDRFIRENFARIMRFARDDVFSKGKFQFFEYTVNPTGTFPKTLAIMHGLNFQPKDVITLSVASPDTATLVWNYDKFSMTHINFTISGGCTIRAFLGRYGESS